MNVSLFYLVLKELMHIRHTAILVNGMPTGQLPRDGILFLLIQSHVNNNHDRHLEQNLINPPLTEEGVVNSLKSLSLIRNKYSTGHY